jgi:methionyl-tRNA formyltransferase
MRVIFMGTPEFAVPVLDALVAAGHDVVAAYSQPPRRGNRGKVVPSPVQARAEALGIEVRAPVTLRDAEAQAGFAALEADVAVVAAYGLILPKPILDAPRLGCLNVHASLLPRWRGAAPIQRAILAGDAETGVCIMQMEAGLDTGPVRLCERTSLTSTFRDRFPARLSVPSPTPSFGKSSRRLTAELSAMGARLIVTVLADPGAYPAVPQPEDGVTYASKIDKREARLDFTQAAEAVERQIRAFNLAPGAFFELCGERFRVYSAELVDVAGLPGVVLDARLTIACGDCAIRPLDIQRAGRGVMTAEDLLRGFPIPVGTQL